MSVQYIWTNPDGSVSSPQIKITVSHDNVERQSSDSTKITGTISVVLNGLASTGSYFGYSIQCAVNNQAKVLKDTTYSSWTTDRPEVTWNLTAYTTESRVDVPIYLTTEATRGKSMVYHYYINVDPYIPPTPPTPEPTYYPSVPSVSPLRAEVGSTVTISMSHASGISPTHNLFYSIDAYNYMPIANGVGNSTTWTVPSYIVSSASQDISVLILCVTYIGGTQIGYEETYLQVYKSQPTPVDNPPYVSSGWATVHTTMPQMLEASYSGKYIENISKCYVSFDTDKITLYSGATIAKLSVTSGGIEYTATNNDTEEFELSSATPTASVVCTVIDSNGLSASEQITVDYVSYTPVRITSATAQRCDAQGAITPKGDHVKLYVAAAIDELSGVSNSPFISVQFYKDGEYIGGYTTSISPMNITAGGDGHVETFIPQNSYTVEVSVMHTISPLTGGFGVNISTKQITMSLDTSPVALNISNGGVAAAFGRYADTENTFSIPSNWAFRIGTTGITEEQLQALLRLIQ